MTRTSYAVMALFVLASAVLSSVLTRQFSVHPAEAQSSQVTASRYVLADYWGNQRAALELTDFGGVQLSVEGYFGDTPRTSLSVQPSGSTGVDLRDASGRIRASLSLAPDGSPMLVMLDQFGRILWSAP
jgi:hypothetical protein